MALPAEKLELRILRPRPTVQPVRARGFRVRLGRVVMVLVLVYFAVLLAGQQVQMARLSGEITALQQQVEIAEGAKLKLQEQVSVLDSPGYIELLARRELGLLMPGEIAIHLIAVPQAGR